MTMRKHLIIIIKNTNDLQYLIPEKPEEVCGICASSTLDVCYNKFYNKHEIEYVKEKVEKSTKIYTHTHTQ